MASSNLHLYTPPGLLTRRLADGEGRGGGKDKGRLARSWSYMVPVVVGQIHPITV